MGNIDWLPLADLPDELKDGREVLLWCVHANAQYSDDPIGEGWAAPVVARWIDHNGGGWTWNGLAGAFTHFAEINGPA